jgi:subtilisin family serine protease
MRRHLLLCLASLVAACWSHHAVAGSSVEPVMIKGHPAHPTRVLARRSAPTSEGSHAAALAATGLAAVHRSALVPGLVVLDAEKVVAKLQSTGAGGVSAQAALAALPPDEALLARIETLEASGLYDYVEPDYLVFADAEPDDARFRDGTLWGLRNLGFEGGTAGVDIDAVRAWDVSTGASSIIVAVIDTGIRATHADLAPQMWRNPGEIAGNGIDDDRNGYVDDVFGIDAIHDTGNPDDLHGHGTHVAGTIGAAANDGNPHVGVAWNVRLMACRFLGAQGGYTSDAVKCVDYAVSKGARILNNSWGGGGFSRALYDSIAVAGSRGVLFVAAAGNQAANTDAVPHYPGSYDLPGILTVASHDASGAFSSFSNYGRDGVDLAAPGRSILSCSNVSDASYLVASGTSMATPHVSGVAALVAARFPGIGLTDLRDRIVNSASPVSGFGEKVASGGRLNAYRALTLDPDGRLEIAVTPGSTTTMFSGRTVTIVARVTDLVGLTGATVTARLQQTAATFSLRDDGVQPDAVAGDANYTGSFVVPAMQGQLDVTLAAEAPGKTSAQRTCDYYVIPPPANDHFAARLALQGKADADVISNFGATSEPGEPAHAGQPAVGSVWWTWTAPDTTTATITTEGSSFDTILAVYQGGDLASLQPVVSNDDASADVWTSLVRFGATQGTTYQIAVDGVDGDWGPGMLRLSTAIGPGNDSFSQATTISGTEATFIGNLYNATFETGEPPIAGNTGTGSIWWQWTAPSDGTVQISGAVSALGVYTGATIPTLVPVHLTEEGSSSGVDVRFSAVAGTTYRIAVSGRPTVVPIEEDFTMRLALREAPVNDAFARRIVLTGASTSAAGSSEAATLEAGEPSLPQIGGKASLWWTWTAPTAGSAVFTLTDNAAHQIGIYTGDSLATLTLVASSSSGWTIPGKRHLTITAAAGQTYQIQVMGGRAPFTLAVDVLAAPPNDSFDGRIQLAGTEFEFRGDTTAATREAGEPVPTAYGSGRTLWWRWTAPTTGTATIVSEGGSGAVAIYTGDALGSLARVETTASDPTMGRAIFHTTAGVEYQVWTDGLFNHIGMLRYTLRLDPAPANDMFADRIILSGDLVQTVGSTVRATFEPGESSGLNRGRTIWWAWTASTSGPVQITTSPFAVYLDVSTGESLGALTRVGRTTGNRGGVNFDAVAGTTYVIQAAADSEMSNLPLTIYRGPRPPNDNFADRTPITGATVRVTGSNRGATIESGEPSSASTGIGQTVWWTWTAPADGGVVVDTKGSDFDTTLAIRTGASLATSTFAGSNDDDPAGGTTSRLAFTAQAGVQYHVIVDGKLDATGAIVLNLSQRAAPRNDSYAARTVVSGRKVADPGDSFGASRETGEPMIGGFATGSTVWFEWTPPSTGVAVVRVKDGEFEPVVGVYTGTALGTLLPVANLEFLSPYERVAFRADPQVTYKIAVASRGASSGRFTLSIELEPHPINDDFAARVVLSGSSVTGSGTTVGASFEAGEPNHSMLPVYCTVWWSWTAPATGTYHVNTLGTKVGAILGVYTGASVNALTKIASVANSANGNRLDLAATAGTTYHFVVAHAQGMNGPANLTIHQGLRPANDDFSSAIELTGLEIETAGHNRAATSEMGEPAHGGVTGDTSVWWTWTAPLAARVLITTEGSNTDTVLAVYRGDALGALVPVASNDNAAAATRSSALLLDAEQGVTYRIAVTGAGGAMGDLALAIIAGVEPISVGLGASDTTVTAGGNLDLQASAFGTGPLVYQWYRDGVAVPGAVDATLRLRCAQAFQAGVYTVRVLNAFGEKSSAPMPVTVAAPPVSDARVVNLSTRALCQTGDNVLIPGFYISGAGTKRLLMRAVGPELAAFGVAGVLADPQVVLRRAGESTVLASNDDWGTGGADAIRAAGRSVYAFDLAEGSKSAALLMDLPAGGYTLTASGKGDTAGVSIVELYEVSGGSESSRLINISNRGHVGVGGNIMIPGFVVSEEGPRTFLIRVVGPSLAQFGVSGVLADPKLELYKRRPGTAIDDLLFTNDTWGENGDAAAIRQTATAVHAFGLVEGSRDAAFVVTLPPGAYTVNAKGMDDTTGVALVEVYLVP